MSTASMEPSPSPPSPSLSNHSSNVMMSSSHLISTNSVVGGITSVPNNSVAITNQTNNAISNGTSIKYGTLVPNRIFVGGISSTTTEADLHKLFSAFGNVKATKIISDRGGCSKGYGFVTFETEEEAKKLQAEADNIILKERKLNIAPAIKKQQPYTRTYEMGQPVLNGAIYYHNGIPYTYQNGMALFQDGMGGAGNPNTSSPSSAAAAALAVANSQIPPAAAFMIPHAMAAASQQQAAAAAMFLPAANSAAAAAAAQQFNTYQQQAVAAAALQQQQISGVAAQTSSCSTTNSTSISGATNGNTPWRWVSQASSNGHANGVGGHGASSPVTHHQQMAFQQDPTLYSNPPATPAMSYTMAPDGMWYSYPPPTGGVGFVNTPTWDSKDMGYVSMESPFNFSHDSQHPPYEMASDTPKAITQDILDQHGGSSVSVPVMTSPGFNVAPPPLVYSYPPNYNQGMPMGGSPQSWNMGVGNRDGTYSVPWNGPMYPQDPPPPLPGHIQHTKSDLKGGLAKLDGRKLSYELQSGVRNGPKKMDGQRHNNYNKHSVSSSEGAPGGNPSWFDPHNSSRPPPSVSRPFRGGFTKPPGSLFPRGGSLLGKPLQFEGIQGRSRWFGNPNGGRKPNLNTFKRHEPPRRGMPNKDLADQNVGVCHVCPAHSPAKRGCKGSGTVGRTGGFGPNGKNTKNVAKTSTEAKNKTDVRQEINDTNNNE